MTIERALELWRQGQLERSLRELELVDPDEAIRRLRAELLAYRGEFDEVWPDLAMLAVAEEARFAVFDHGEPTGLTAMPEHIRYRWQAFVHFREGNEEAALASIDAADEASPWLEGHLNGMEFEGFRDLDDRLAHVLEFVEGSTYGWMPLEWLRSLRFAAMRSPLDQLYRPAELTGRDGSVRSVRLPLLYPGSSAADDEDLVTGVSTDWFDTNGGLMIGIGLHDYQVGEAETQPREWEMLEIRRVHAP